MRGAERRRRTRGGRGLTHTAAASSSIDTPVSGDDGGVGAAVVKALRGGIPILLGLAGLEAYLRVVTAAMKALGVTIAPLICGLVALSLLLLLAPSVERILSKTLKPAVNAIDTQIACIFIPYITAVPISNLPAGGHLWVAMGVCLAGYLATMTIAGYAAQATAAMMGRKDVEKCDVDAVVLPVAETSKVPSPPPPSTSTHSPAAAKRSTPREVYWLCVAAAFGILGAMAVERSSVAASVAATPAYLCITVAVYLLSRRVPPRLQRLGLFPTITAGVAMALITAAAGAAGVVLPGAGEPWAAGIRLYMKGAGAVLLYFVPPAVLGLAFRVHAQRKVLAANAFSLAVALSLAVPGGLILAASLGRLAGLPTGLILASLPKCTTTGLAVAMAAQLGVDPSLVAAGCALSGTVGLACGRLLMDVAGVNGPVARGVATGTSSHAAGTAALAAGGEEGAAAVSGVTFALSGVMGVLLLECPPFRALLFAIAGVA